MRSGPPACNLVRPSCAAIGGKVIIHSGRPSDMFLQLFGSIVANPLR
jgi:hypothetical protein